MTSAAESVMRCPLCGEEADAMLAADVRVHHSFPAYARSPVPNRRFFTAGDHVLLHHACSSRQASSDVPMWNPDRSWWACRDADRPLDPDAYFDLNCMECAIRWATSIARSD